LFEAKTFPEMIFLDATWLQTRC